MQTLTIKAVSLESAEGFMSGLAGFHAELLGSDDASYVVQITVEGGDREIIALLNALEDYVTHRGDGPAEVGLRGRTYKLHPTDPPRRQILPVLSPQPFS